MRSVRVFGLAFLLGLVSATAAADVPPPGLAECNDREVGAACTIGGQSGACQQSTCSRLDYSDGTPPRGVQYDCVLCVAGATPTGGGGCAVQPVRAARASVLGLGLVATALVFVARRRRASRTFSL
jgi:hypothetical protein